MSALARVNNMQGADDAKVECTIVLGYPSEGHAAKVLNTVESDNEGYVEARLEGDTMVVTIRAESLNSLLHTLDDFLACVSVAEKIISE